MHFPDQPIDWGYLLDKFMCPSSFCFKSTFTERLQFLIMCGMSDRVEALALKVWREGILKMIRATEFNHSHQSLNQNMVIDEYCDPSGNQNVISRIQATISHFEDEYSKLKEVTIILELAVWKLRMNENIFLEKATPYQKKIKTDESSIRRQCRITCGADDVIRHVMPFLISVVD
jgi:hypothetical protein